LAHQDGSIDRAEMSNPAMLRGDDPVALIGACFGAMNRRRLKRWRARAA
jgi:hypothetical protein